MGVAFIAVMNLYLGRLFATMGLPVGVVGRRSLKADVCFFGCGCVGLGILLLTTGLRLTVYQAVTLSATFVASNAFIRGRFGSGEPPEPWDQFLNRRVHTVEAICSRHGWDLTNQEATVRLAEAGLLHFDEADFDALVQMQGKQIGRLRQNEPLPPSLAGEPDYDRASAREIVSLTHALAGYEGTEGAKATVSQDYDLTGFDHASFQRMEWVASALIRQWGLSGLYGGHGA